MDENNFTNIQTEPVQMIIKDKLTFLPIIIFFLIMASLVIFKVIPQKEHIVQPKGNLPNRQDYPQITPTATAPIKVNTPVSSSSDPASQNQQNSTDPDKTILLSSDIVSVLYDPAKSTTPESAFNEMIRNVIMIKRINNSEGDNSFDHYIITDGTIIQTNGTPADKSVLERSNFVVNNENKYTKADVVYYIYYNEIGLSEYVAKSINLKN